MLGTYELNTDGSWAYGQGTVSDTYQNHERNDKKSESGFIPKSFVLAM